MVDELCFYVIVSKSVQFIVNDKVVIMCLLKIDMGENHGKKNHAAVIIPVFCIIAAWGSWYQSSN